MIFTIIIFIAVLAVLVLAHEVGHFVAARKFGCKVEEFGFGFPPRILGWQILKRKKLEKVGEIETVEVSEADLQLADGREVLQEVVRDEVREIDKAVEEKEKKIFWGSKNEAFSEDGGTIYSLNWIPLGGFVKIKGEDGENRSEPDSFGYKKIWQRAIILAAGVAMNFFLAIAIFSGGFMVGMPQAVEGDMSGAKIANQETIINLVQDKTPATEAGIQLGDGVISVNGEAIKTVEQLQNLMNTNTGKEVAVELKRGGENLTVKITPRYSDELKRGVIGVGLVQTGTVSYPWHLAIYRGTVMTGSLVKEILWAFGGIFRDLFMGHKPAVDVSGPVGIAVMTGQVAAMGWVYLLQFIALLSVNLAIINFLPFPALDGGRILFLIIEAIRRRPINQKIENAVHNIGFALLMILVLLVTYRDVVHFVTK